MKIYCCQCKKEVDAVKEESRYYANDYLFRCPECRNYVTTDCTGMPVGTIPSKEIAVLRKGIHCLISDLAMSWKYTRSEIHKMLLKEFGNNFAVQKINTKEDAESVMKFIQNIRNKAFSFSYTKNMKAHVGSEIRCYCGKLFHKSYTKQICCCDKCEQEYKARKG